MGVLTVVAAFALVVVALVWWLRHTFVVVSVSGRSMEPTLTDGQWVVARRAGLSRIRRGDVVIVSTPPDRPDGDRYLIKRVFAMPGDPVPRARVPRLRDLPDETVPADQLVLLGDNPPLSLDSRQLGLIPAERLLGVLPRYRT
jgi:signal peptidase I